MFQRTCTTDTGRNQTDVNKRGKRQTRKTINENENENENEIKRKRERDDYKEKGIGTKYITELLIFSFVAAERQHQELAKTGAEYDRSKYSETKRRTYLGPFIPSTI